MKNMKFVFAVSFCAMFAASAALASAPKLDNSDIGSAHGVFAELPLTGEESEGIAGVTYVNRAVNSAGAAAIAAEAHAAAAGAYAVSAKTSADNAAAAADSAATAAGKAKTAAASALQKGDIVTGTSNGTISVGGTEVAVQGLGSAAYTDAAAYATAAQGALADSAVQPTDLATALDGKQDKFELGDNITITDGKINATLPIATTSTLGGVKVGENLSINGDGVLSATVPTLDNASTTTAGIVKLYDATGENTDGTMTQRSVTEALAGKADKGDVPTGALASLNTVGSSEITDDAVTTAKILDGEVKTDDIADSAVTTPKIADSAVTAAKIADSAVTTAKIADSAVTATKTTGIIGKVPSGSEDSTTLASIWLQ